MALICQDVEGREKPRGLGSSVGDEYFFLESLPCCYITTLTICPAQPYTLQVKAEREGAGEKSPRSSRRSLPAGVWPGWKGRGLWGQGRQMPTAPRGPLKSLRCQVGEGVCRGPLPARLPPEAAWAARPGYAPLEPPAWFLMLLCLFSKPIYRSFFCFCLSLSLFLSSPSHIIASLSFCLLSLPFYFSFFFLCNFFSVPFLVSLFSLPLSFPAIGFSLCLTLNS